MDPTIRQTVVMPLVRYAVVASGPILGVVLSEGQVTELTLAISTAVSIIVAVAWKTWEDRRKAKEAGK